MSWTGLEGEWPAIEKIRRDKHKINIDANWCSMIKKQQRDPSTKSVCDCLKDILKHTATWPWPIAQMLILAHGPQSWPQTCAHSQTTACSLTLVSDTSSKRTPGFTHSLCCSLSSQAVIFYKLSDTVYNGKWRYIMACVYTPEWKVDVQWNLSWESAGVFFVCFLTLPIHAMLWYT